LVLYNAVGEKSTTKTGAENQEEWISEKKKMSSILQDELANRYEKVMARKVELQPHIDDGEIAKFLGHRKRRGATATKASNKKPRLGHFESSKHFINKRVAKDFPIGEEDGKVTYDVFFGTVRYISNEGRLWFYVQYDDGDSEEYNMKELEQALKYYDEQKAKDRLAISGKDGSGQDGEQEDSKPSANDKGNDNDVIDTSKPDEGKDFSCDQRVIECKDDEGKDNNVRDTSTADEDKDFSFGQRISDHKEDNGNDNNVRDASKADEDKDFSCDRRIGEYKEDIP
jgi:hypothetical protein